MARELVAILKCDLAGWTKLSKTLSEGARLECLRQYHDAVEHAVTGFEAREGPHWEGEGGTSYFAGSGAVENAVRAARQAVELVRTIPRFELRLRAAAGVDEVEAGADLTKATPDDFNLAGHAGKGEVTPPSAVSLTENAYQMLRATAPADAAEFGYLGATADDHAPAFVWPPGKRPEKPGGLLSADQDGYPALGAIETWYTRPPFSHLRFYALPQFKFVGSLDLMAVFTPLWVRRRREDLQDAVAAPERPEEARAAVSSDLPTTEAIRMGGSAPAPREPFAEVFHRHRSLVILGEPGSGKTTLLRYLAIAAAGGRPGLLRSLGLWERWVPLHFAAADLLDLRRRFPVAPWPEVLARGLSARGQRAWEEVLLGLQETGPGRLLFLVDGLDEVPARADRDAITGIIAEIAHAFPGSRFVVASRIVGYPGVALPEAAEYVLEPLSPEQTRTLARSFYREMYRSQGYMEDRAAELGSHQGNALADALDQRERLRLFAQSPLLLSLAALVHVQLGELPRHRVKLYDVATETLVDAWARARRPVSPGPDRSGVDYETEGRAVLLPLAHHLHRHCPGGLIPTHELLKQISATLPGATAGKDTFGDEAKAKDFLARLEQAGALLVERGSGQWGFAHQTFQEYMAAKYLVTEDRHPELVERHLYDARWQEVIRFAAAELGVLQGRSKEAARFLRAILDDARDWRATDLKMNLLPAATCLADTICQDAAIEERIVQAISDRIVNRMPAPPQGPFDRTLQLIRGTPLARAIAERVAPFGMYHRGLLLGPDEVTDELIRDLRVGRGLQIQGAAWVAGHLGASKAINDLRRLARESPDDDVRAAAVGALGDLGDRGAGDLLLSVIKDGKEDAWVVLEHAVAAYGKVFTRDAIPELLALASGHGNAWVRVAALWQLAGFGCRDAIPMLRALLGEQASAAKGLRVRPEAWLGQVGDRDSEAAIVRGLEDADGRRRGSAAEGLSWLGASETIPALRRALARTDGDGAAIGRKHAALALGRLNAREAIPDLIGVLREPEGTWGKEGASRALALLRAFEAVPDLLSQLRHGPVHEAAAEALWEIAEAMEGVELPAA